MLFNSFVFIWFFAIVYSGYLLLSRNAKAQNVVLLVAGYVFYSYWDWRFLGLLLISTVVDYAVANWLFREQDPRARKWILAISLCLNLGFLGFFKYWNFFTDSTLRLCAAFGWHPDLVTLNIVLPAGISFYTFQSMNYTIDIYRREMKPARSLLDFALFVSFFPHLVAGPIMRASHLLPQVEAPRRITSSQVHAGLFLILWGYFTKVVVADNVALIANQIFNNYRQFQGLDLVVGILAFAVQIYGDFSGYSNIARGLAKLMGFELMVNFNLPYFALSPSDFWQRWHISLSTWLRDYLYIPLGGNRRGPVRTYVNLTLTMLLGGLWHGAAWHFVLWGAYHGLLLVAYRLLDRDPPNLTLWSAERPRLYLLGKMGLMLVLTMVGWVLFRASSLEQIGYMLTHAGVRLSDGSGTLDRAYNFLFFSAPLFLVEWWQYAKRDQLAPTKVRLNWRIPLYSAVFVWLCIFGVRASMEFIYFQF